MNESGLDISARPSFPGLIRKRLVDQAVDHLREMILAGKIAPGTKLLQEQVAAELGVSRTPLREAIRVLVYEGLLIPVAGGGSVEVVELSETDARELYEVREVLDGLAARLCAGRPHQLPAVQLQEALDEMRLATNEPFDAQRFNHAHTMFHLTLVEAAGNRRLIQTQFIVQMSAQMLFPRLEASQRRMLSSVAEHQAIFEAISTGAADEAERLARAHIAAAATYWLDQA